MYYAPDILRQYARIAALLDRLQPEHAPEAVSVPPSNPPEQTVIVFPGSFNPPTEAHLAMLRQAQSFIAAQTYPAHLYCAFSKRTIDKESVERPLLLDRVLLLQRVLQRRLPLTGILLFNRGLYLEQAQAIRYSFPRVKHIFFLMGFDKIVQIFDPRYYANRDRSLDELFQLAQLLVAPREENGSEQLQALLQQPQNKRYARFVHALALPAQYRHISSTHARTGNLQQVPHEVRRFIARSRAYAPPIQQVDGSTLDVYAEHVRDVQDQIVAYQRKRRGIFSTLHGR